MYDSAILRIPWYLRYTMFLVDSFHYAGHTCCNVFNGNLHRFLDDGRSAAAEVINSAIEKCVSHITYLKGANVIPFMQVLFRNLNPVAQVRVRTGKGDLEDEDIASLIKASFMCN